MGFLEQVTLMMLLLLPCFGARKPIEHPFISMSAGTGPTSSGWEWVARMAEMGGHEFGRAATPVLHMCRNVQNYNPMDDQSSMLSIHGWALSTRMEPLVVPQAAGQLGSVLALVYEEEVPLAAEQPRAVIAFRGHMTVAGELETCAMEFLPRRSSDTSCPSLNATFLFMCFATYSAASLDYYSLALAYTLEALQHYPAFSVLMAGNSMGANVAQLATVGLWTHYRTALPAMVFQDGGPRASMEIRDLSVQGYNSTVVSIGNQWDPVVRLNWDNHVGTLCLLPPPTSQEPPYSCIRCFSSVADERGVDCSACSKHNHNSSLLLERFAEGQDPTCYSMPYIDAS